MYDKYLYIFLILIYSITLYLFYLNTTLYIVKLNDRLFVLNIFLFLPGLYVLISTNPMLIISIPIFLGFIYIEKLKVREIYIFIYLPFFLVDYNFFILYLSLIPYYISFAKFRHVILICLLIPIMFFIHIYILGTLEYDSLLSSAKGGLWSDFNFLIIYGFTPLLFIYILYIIFNSIKEGRKIYQNIIVNTILWTFIIYSIFLIIGVYFDIKYMFIYLAPSLILAVELWMHRYRLKLFEFRLKYRVIAYLTLGLQFFIYSFIIILYFSKSIDIYDRIDKFNMFIWTLI